MALMARDVVTLEYQLADLKYRLKLYLEARTEALEEAHENEASIIALPLEELRSKVPGLRATKRKLVRYIRDELTNYLEIAPLLTSICDAHRTWSLKIAAIIWQHYPELESELHRWLSNEVSDFNNGRHHWLSPAIEAIEEQLAKLKEAA